jgi:hypothetical protein
MNADFQRFQEAFYSLNAEILGACEEALFAYSKARGPALFDDARQFADGLLQHFLDCAIKRAEHAILDEYFDFLGRAKQRLLEEGQYPEAQLSLPAEADAPSLALVPSGHYSSLQWAVVNSQPELHEDLMRAVDATRNRNTLVLTVFETLFLWMQSIDLKRALKWELSLCGEGGPAHDPDICRELLRAWQTVDALPTNILARVCTWSKSARLYRQWPAVVEEADKVLRQHALRAWFAECAAATSETRALQRLAPFLADRRMRRWYHSCIDSFGDRIAFFVRQANLLAEDSAASAQRRQDVLMGELRGIAHLTAPLLLISDLILASPTGALDFAMAIFGFSELSRERWERALEEKAKRIVRRAFVLDLKNGRPPDATIRRLSFDNEQMCELCLSELDLCSGQFDSLAQREVVVNRLSGSYASFRHDSLLATELGKRFRHTMRVLHEDNLQRVLRKDQHGALDALRPTLLEVAIVATESRRFLGMRRALEKSTDEILAAEEQYIESMRALRTRRIEGLLGIRFSAARSSAASAQ